MRVYCDKMAEAIITQFSLESSKMSTYNVISLTRNSTGSPLFGVQSRVGGLQPPFQRNISETGRDRT